MMILLTKKEELMPLYDFCNIIPQDILDEKDIDNLPKFKVEVLANKITCIVRNENAESVYITFKGHGIIFIDDGKQNHYYKITGDEDTSNLLNILSRKFSVSINSISMINKRKEGF